MTPAAGARASTTLRGRCSDRLLRDRAGCKPHAGHHDVCRRCMEACRSCASACEKASA